MDDTTPEKLVDMMEMQNGCITVASAEGGVFDAINGRYDRAANFASESRAIAKRYDGTQASKLTNALLIAVLDELQRVADGK